MRRKLSFLFPLILLWLGMYSHAQLWSGVLSPSRAVDWSAPGVTGGIPSRSTICQTLGTAGQAPSFAQTVTTAQINNAIAACSGTDQTVYLNPGTYTVSMITFAGSHNVTLRGAGADQTILAISGGGGNCGYLASICFFGDATGSQNVTNSPTNWTAGYAQGTTTLTLTGPITNLAVGKTISLDQLSEASDGYPHVGGLYMCATANVCTGQGGGGWGRPGRLQLQYAKVTNISGSGPYQVTIDHGLAMPDWRSSQSPQAWWPSTVNHDNGLENLTVDNRNGSVCATCGNIVMFNVRDCWIRGVRSIQPNGSGGQPLANHVWLYQVTDSTIRDSYFYGSDNSSQSYGIGLYATSFVLAENNIFQHVSAPMVGNGPEAGDVFGYNFFIDDNWTNAGTVPQWMQTAAQHEAATNMTLWEGNSGLGFTADNIHGTHAMGTFYRNQFYGDIWNNPPKTANTAVIQLGAFSRFYNIVGNVLGRSGYYNQYNGGSNGLYWLGGAYPGAPYGYDAYTSSTTLRWGNYDNVTGATRWCGNSSDTGWSTTCSSVSEVPAGDANYPNAIPTKGDVGIGQPALPASFYLSSKPAWFGSVPWPPIGPDVAGGNSTVSGSAGHANVIPAETCWRNVMNGVIGSSGLLTFNADACYASNGNSSPVPPGGLTAIIH